MKHANFSQLIQKHLKKTGISMRELARRMGLPQATPGHWKSGRNAPTDEQAATAAAHLGLTAEEAEEFLVLASLCHIPDTTARSRILNVYHRLNALELRLKNSGQ